MEMFASLGRLPAAVMFCAAASACGGPAVPDQGWIAALDQLQTAIVSSTGYPAGSIEVLGSPVRVRVTISDRELARADEVTRERVANAVVSAAEDSIATNARLTAVNEIRVVIVHPEAVQGLLRSTHTEDVMEFRKGPNQHFYRDVL
jgi:O-acetyl-ADP-ribose deacetylase (regulator of RNase III)